MLDALVTLIGAGAALGLMAFIGTLVVAIATVYATAIRVGPTGSSHIRRVNYVWFRRVRRVFYFAFALELIYLLLQALRD